MLYNLDNIPIYKKNIKKGIITMIVSFLVTLLMLGIITIFVNYDTIAWLTTTFKVISIILFVCMGWIELYTLIDIILLNNNKIKVLEALDRASNTEIDGCIISIDKIITISKYEKAYVINVEASNKNLSCYYSTDFNDMPLEANKNYHLVLANNKIIDFKELD